MTRPAYVLSVAAVIAFLLAASVTRQYWWVTELSDLQQDQADRSLRLSAEGFVRELDREIEQLWYTLHVREGFEPEREIADDFRRWSETAAHPELVARVYWIAEAEGDEVTVSNDPPRRFDVQAVDLESGAFVPLPATTALDGLLVELGERRPRRRRRGFGPEDGVVMTLGPNRYGVVVPQPTRRDRAWAVAELSTLVLRRGLLASLVRDHFGREDEREYDVRVYQRAATAPAIFATDEADRADVWDAPDFADRNRYFEVAVRHRQGSIPIAVANVRRGNLVFTFGTVVVLLAGLGALAVTTRRAQRLVDRQTEFVAGVSHELRTPISGISVLSQNLADGVVREPAQAAAYGRSIQAESRRLSDMVEGVLQLSAIRSGGYQYDFKPLDVRTVVAACVAGLEAEDRARVQMTMPAALPWCVADERALTSSVRNLISNALKFGGPSPQVHVSVDTRDASGREMVEIRVQDQGVGIDPRDQRHVFDAFYRGRAAHDAQTPGSGLGLSVVRSVAEAHGGSVRVESAPGQGSTFTIALPVAADGAAPRRTSGGA